MSPPGSRFHGREGARVELGEKPRVLPRGLLARLREDDLRRLAQPGRHRVHALRPLGRLVRIGRRLIARRPRAVERVGPERLELLEGAAAEQERPAAALAHGLPGGPVELRILHDPVEVSLRIGEVAVRRHMIERHDLSHVCYSPRPSWSSMATSTGPNLHRAAAFHHRASAGQLHRLRHVPRLDDDEAQDQILLRVRPVGDRLLPAAHDLPRRVQRLAWMLQVPFRFEIADPGQPRLQALLCALGCAHGFAPPGLRRSEQVDELAHRVLPCSAQLKLRPPHAFSTSTCDGRRAGHISSAGGNCQAWRERPARSRELPTCGKPWRRGS